MFIRIAYNTNNIIPMEKGTLHFTIGEDFGILLATIAQEHLIYNLDVDKAIKTITEGLMGCPEDLAIEIIKGTQVIVVDTEKQECLVCERQHYHEGIYPKINMVDWYINKAKELNQRGDELKRNVDRLIYENNKNTTILLSIDKLDVLKRILGVENKNLIELLEDNYQYRELSSLVFVIKNYIDEGIKTKAVMSWIQNNFSDELQVIDEHLLEFDVFNKALSTIISMYNDMFTLNKDDLVDFSGYNEQKSTLDSYMSAVIENDKAVKAGLSPVNILDGYSAGWLSPEGEYYGLNGEIANMLHNQIADALQEQGIVPKDINNYSWLEQHGWVKIHGNSVDFAGCLNNRLDLKDVDMTKEQIDAIHKYIQVLHDGVMKLGWKRQLISAAKFEMFAKVNLPYIYRNYFDF